MVRGKVVSITGASRGLGAALARHFAAAGARLSLCARTGKDLEMFRDETLGIIDECLVETVDIADADAVRHWLEHTDQQLGPTEVLINNASLLGPRVPLAEFPIPEWRRILDVNLTGVLVAMQTVLPEMLASGEGSIINVSSGAAIPPRVNWGAYAISKQAVDGLSLNLARELEGSGVRVNIVDPGAMRTGMRAAAYPEEDPDRLKPPDSIAPLFLWLAGDDSAGVTGQRIRADEWLEGRQQLDGEGKPTIV